VREHRFVAAKVSDVATENREDARPVNVINRTDAIKTNIADSLNVVIQLERRPGRRFVSEVLEINSYDPDADLFDFRPVYVASEERT
jgi:hypothetical protein